jgi:site-specific DNA-methyltransferase (adenine-specific)
MSDNKPIETNYTPDVLSCLADLSNDEVFTPPDVAKAMIDFLPQELFRNPNTTFLDPAVKSGVFLREIAKRLIIGLTASIPNLQERLDHIFHKQLYGVAITELTSLMSRRSLYCSKYPNGKYSIVNFNDVQGNIRFKEAKHVFSKNHCVYCGCGERTFGGDRNGLETHAYEFIHTTKPEEIFNMKFDVIIGNPPYQLSDGGNKASAVPIYQDFIGQAKKLNPRFLSMIVPARWYAGGRGLDDFRDSMLKDNHLLRLVDYTDSEDCFPGVDIAGGVCYFLWSRDTKGDCLVTNIFNGKALTASRKLDAYDTFIRYSQAVPIIEKVRNSSSSFLESTVSSQKPFGLRTYVKPQRHGDLVLRYNGGKGPFSSKDVEAGFGWINKWKVISSYLTYDHAGRPDKDGKRRVFSTMEILKPNEICTETYLVIDAFDTEEEAQNCFNYLQTCFVRFLISQLTYTQHLSKSNFAFVPLLDFKKQWDDVALFAKYSLSKEEIAFIKETIRPMNRKETGNR